MKQLVNKVYGALYTKKPRYFFLMGGRAGGRSTAASQFANAKLVSPEYFRCAIMRYILGDIRNSIYREITDRAEENGILDELKINDSMMTIEYGANSINAVGFKKSSSDQTAKLKSLANYNCVIIEEADEIPEEDFMQLDDTLRTLKGDITIIFLLNPPPRLHWIIQRFFDLEPSGIKDFYIPVLKKSVHNAVFIRTTYKDNIANLSPQTPVNYEAYKASNPGHYYNMVQGLVPEVVQGKIYSGWKVIDEVPHEARLERHWLDFGYSNHPTAIGDLYYYNGGYILDEQAYQTNLMNRQIADILMGLAPALTVADSAEPKSIDEIMALGVNIQPAVKGQGSILQGIQVVQSQKISVTRRSVNIWKEYNNYAWKKDKEGTVKNEPQDAWNHHMDGIRYVLQSLLEFLPEQTKSRQADTFARNENRQELNSTR